MNDDSNSGVGGLAWPEAYKDLQSLIADQWGVGDELYLTRQLGHGKSGALVFLADVTSENYAGQAILKLDQAPDPEQQEKSEADRHIQAAEAEPDFAERHLPKVVYTAHDGKSLAILSTVAARGLEFVVPWELCDHDRQVDIAKRLSRTLLEDWNRSAQLASGLQSPQTLLRGWLGHRLDAKYGRLRSEVAEILDLPPEEPSFLFEGQWYPNPTAFAIASLEAEDQLKLRALIGHIHGDLNGFNVLVGKTGANKDQYFLIDLAFYETRQYLFFDHAYFSLSYLLSARSQTPPAQWYNILEALCPYDHLRSNIGLKGDDVGLVALLQNVRQEVFNWVDRYQTNRFSYMDSQFQLAQVAVGLNFANKRIDNRLRRYSFIYAAAALKDYIRLHNIDWPMHGPPIRLEGRTKKSPAPSSTVAQPVSEGLADDGNPPLPEKPAIAVMALENQSGDPDQEVLADGMTDEIILELSRVDWLMVIGRGSTFAYKGKSIDAKQIGKELGVHYLVEGAVRRSGDRIRVSTQLIDALTGEQLWADRFDRDLDDLFELQDEVALAIVANIEPRLKLAEREQAKRKAGNITLWEAFQRAMWHVYRINDEDSEIAKKQLTELTEHSPGFSGSHAALAILLLRKVLIGEPGDLPNVLASAQKHAMKAVELDDGNSLARIALSRVYQIQGKYDQAIREAEAAISLNPSSSIGYSNLGATLFWGGRAEDALDALDKSIRLSPKGPLFPINLLAKGLCFYFLDKFDEAEAYLEKSEASPLVLSFSKMILSAVYLRQNRLEDARAAIAEAREQRPNMSLSGMETAWRTLSPQYRDKLLHDLKAVGLDG